jgi:hypothetical protein
MVLTGIATCLLILLLSRISLKNSQTIYIGLYKITKTRSLAQALFGLFFLPGIIIHELSHALIATFLGVRLGKINLFPSIYSHQKQLVLGSVEVAKTDFIRQSLIGAAPTLIGSLILLWLTSLVFPTLTQFNVSQLINLINHSSLVMVAAIYLIFVISSTFQTSSSDRTAWPLFLLLIAIISIVLYSSHLVVSPKLVSLLGISLIRFNFALGFSLAVNLILFAFTKLLKLTEMILLGK